MKVSVILPTYNEAKNIVPLVQAIEGHLSAANLEYELVVVDDNSPDGTAKVVQERAQSDAQIKLYVRTKERGLATAVKHGLLHADGEVVVVMDTDFSHDPKMLSQMVRFLEYYDIVIGSRFVMGGGMEDKLRCFFSFLYNVFVRLVLRTPVQDNLSGFFSMGRDKLMQMGLDNIFKGYGEYFVRLLFLARCRGYSMLEVPVFCVRRPYGQSKSRLVKMLVDYTRTLCDLKVNYRNLRQKAYENL